MEYNSVGETIKVTALGPEGKKTWNIIPVHIKGNTIQRFVASSLIRDLQENKSYYHVGGTQINNHIVKSEIIRLGLKYQLATTHTSFIAVEELSTAASGTMQNVQLETKAPTFLNYAESVYKDLFKKQEQRAVEIAQREMSERIAQRKSEIAYSNKDSEALQMEKYLAEEQAAEAASREIPKNLSEN